MNIGNHIITNGKNDMTNGKSNDDKHEVDQPPPSSTKLQNGNMNHHDTSITTTTIITTNTTATNDSGGYFIAIFRHGVHTIMFLLALLLAIAYIMQSVYHEYYVPLMKRAQRSDKKLMDEYTYYDRTCNLVDVTATSPDEASSILYSNDKVDDAVNIMMTHGAIMIPNLLSQDLITELRKFVVQKNSDVKGTPAEYPVSQGRNRISYGIEAAEHPVVSRTLQSLHHNNKLKNLLEGLVGPNPALTEITAITAYYGCPSQAWHSDVKADGYAAKFGRTYSHSYSLFIPLQNTTKDMGATDICLGTHYCTDEIQEICEEKKIGMHQVNGGDGDDGGGVWKAGDAALLNQQVWHRGAKHRSKNSLERIVFIVSFIGRPIDTRQLARGTYFHMKWNMWGHTWQDLADSAVSMIWPLSVLRCLHIWKPKGRDWGYDLLTATAMRVANRQNGCEPEDLETLVGTLERMRLPNYLFGTIDYDNKNAWTIFIPETIAKAIEFLRQVNIGVLCIYVLILMLVAIRNQNAEKKTTGGGGGLFSMFLRSAVRLLVLYGTVWGLFVYTLHGIRTSPWATSISSGRTLMRPFPPANRLVEIDNDPGVSHGPTTLPTRQDVLIGTRMNTKKLGAYRHWIKFHTGNRIFQRHVDKIGRERLYKSYEGLPKVFAEQIIEGAYQSVTENGGRFLQQDYMTGDWRLMDEPESKEHVRLRLFLSNNPLMNALKDSIDLLLDEYRFEVHRGTALSRFSQQYIFDLETILFGTDNSKTDKPSSPLTAYRPSRTFQVVPLAKTARRNLKRSIPELTAFRDNDDFPLFSDVFVEHEDGWMQGTIVGFTSKGKVEVALYGEESYHYGVKVTVPRKVLHKCNPNTEGMRVEANYKGKDEWFFGRITRVRPNGQADVLYDDGDVEKGVEYYNYWPLEY